ncbi:MAG TPA: alpha-glucan family phosphorylase [Candidatus Acidoferrales bacterium]|nr:alpha-glucan family phosphorylase [Candidatus Acidoferrales bacterium]
MGSSPVRYRSAKAATLQALSELALNMRWSYNHAADRIWEHLTPELWESTHNPWVVLQTVSAERLQSAAMDRDFQSLVADLHREKQAAEEAESWFQKTHPNSGLTGVAYFSMEFMLSESLPIYSGGLGNVAGDQLKAASNLGVPVMGIGLLYQQGYFRQEIDAHGQQLALYPYNDPGQLPIKPLRQKDDEWLRLSIDFAGCNLWIRVWQAQVGNAKLYLLDTNDPANIPACRGIAGELYGGGPEVRLKQELVLGLGGWQLIEALGGRPEVCHLNEGHAAFAVLERARSYMVKNGQPFEVALAVTRAGNLFTTHTPVAAGFDRFSPELIEKYLKNYAEKELAISFDDLLALGRQNRHDPSEPFNMAYLAVRGSGAVNGVSRLHGDVSRRIFQVLFPRWPEHDVPVTHVTNGVHMPTWDSAEADKIWEAACGKRRWHDTTEALEQGFQKVSDTDLWKLRTDTRSSLVEYVRKVHVRQLTGRGASPDDLAQASQVLDRKTLTLGFARRFATYKRPNLLLHDPQRLERILTNPERPVQLVLAGKAHPADLGGQAMIRQWIQFAYQAQIRSRVVFLSDYDALMAEHLVQGVDVWVNTPRRPWEASGTSGMKVLVNGGLNLSELDGWWAEAYSPEVGWAIGDGREHGGDPSWDATEADQLYRLLEEKIVPEFYTRDDRGIPRAWVTRMRHSMARLTPTFSTNRVVRQYTEQHYIPAATTFRERSANQSVQAVGLLNWEGNLAKHWPAVRFGSASVESRDHQNFFQVQVFLGGLDPGNVAVELYAEPLNGDGPARHAMQLGEPIVGSADGFTFTASIPATRPATDFTPRLIPRREGALVPLEASYILWDESRAWK